MRQHQNKGYLQNKLTSSAFSIITLFVALMIVGIAVIPSLRFKLQPSTELNSLNISFYWPGASAESVEHHAVNAIEEILNTLKGVKNIRSNSYDGYGEVQLDIDEHSSVRQVRYEAAMLLRELYEKLPYGISYPQVRANQPRGANTTLLSYTLNADADPADIEKYAQEHLLPGLSRISGVHHVQIYGASQRQWQIKYDPAKMERYHIAENDIAEAVNRYFGVEEAGKFQTETTNAKQYTYVSLNNSRPDSLDWSKIPIKKVEGTLLYLTDLADVAYTQQQPQSYYRINGLNTINLEIEADRTVNQLLLAKQIKAYVHSVKSTLPASYSMLLSYDSSHYLKEELSKISGRTVATFLLLLLFVWLATRQKRYLLLIVISLSANLLLAFILYAILGLEIHIYSLAAITVSAGMMIDNSIVVIDHIRHQRNLKVILAVAGATLTTIGAVSIIFFLDKDKQVNLLDFAWVMIINLGLSLVIALFLIPALMEKLPLPEQKGSTVIRKKRNILKWNRTYLKIIGFNRRHRFWLVLAIILLFGLPVFLLPINTEGKGSWNQLYNQTLGSEFYNENIRSVIDMTLGGTLRLFLANSEQFNGSFNGNERTMINVAISMPDGATPTQMNHVVVDFENYLSAFKQIDLFTSRVDNGQNANISITFKPEYEKSAYPYILKNNLENKAVNTGLADFQVTGVGQGFNNTVYTQNTNYGLTLHGFNYDDLMRTAAKLRSKLKENPRVEKAFIASERDWDGSTIHNEWVFHITRPQQALLEGMSPQTIQEGLRYFSAEQSYAGHVFYQNKDLPIMIMPDKPTSGIWQVMNEPLRTDSSNYVRLQSFAQIDKERTGETIVRNNQQYQLVVNYNFIGDYTLGNHYMENLIDTLKRTLPLGYSVEKSNSGFWWGQGAKLTWAILLTMGIVLLICSILLNSLKQALAVVTMIPISFIGVFLMVYFFKYSFEEGGYASLIILCGVVVNAALYILNDYNNQKIQKQEVSDISLYLKAYNSKIIPVILSTASMILGLIPFIVMPDKDTFWYTLAMSTIGGLLFSMIALLFYLPLFLIKGSATVASSGKRNRSLKFPILKINRN
ncbi:MAG TPA: efflux RND transporter permease subunit [Pelobium sp.]|nr:efflux RND transporter permease subunit [Pelobium sp.]